MASNPKVTPENLACAHWLDQLVAGGTRVVLPEIVDYEVRRELLRAGRIRGLRRLDALCNTLEYLPITTLAMRQAAEFWAQARRQALPTAPDPALDADVILAAQAFTSGEPNVVIATLNVGHLSRFVPADLWTNI
jgi:predicted nucleic acid-binding protein